MEKNTTFYDTVVSSPQWKLWYEEIMRRHSVNADGGKWEDNKTFDIDESQECGWLGEEHFQEFLKFVSAQAVQEALDTYKEKVEQVIARELTTAVIPAYEVTSYIYTKLVEENLIEEKRGE